VNRWANDHPVGWGVAAAVLFAGVSFGASAAWDAAGTTTLVADGCGGAVFGALIGVMTRRRRRRRLG
jgi:hypothetical protein